MNTFPGDPLYPHARPYAENGIVLAYGDHEVEFVIDGRLPDRVYVAVVGSGGDHCGGFEGGDFARVEMNERGYRLAVRVGSDSCRVYVYDYYDL